MSYPSVYAWQDELSAADFQAALDAAKQDAERVTKEFVAGLGPSSPPYDAEWTTRYGSEDRLIFVFSVVLDLDGDDFDIRDYPRRSGGRRHRGPAQTACRHQGR